MPIILTTEAEIKTHKRILKNESFSLDFLKFNFLNIKFKKKKVSTFYIFENFQQFPLPPVEYLACIYVFKHIFSVFNF